ncbi:tyrosine-type recombinase/integrase [Azonexus hydrophilus]
MRREQDSANTFEAVAREWVALKTWEPITKKRRLDMLTRVAFPKIGVLPVKQITPAHILDVLKTAAKKNGPSVAAEAKRTMSGVFELAVSTLRADTDPTYPVRKALPANKTQHKRPLGPEEVGQLLRDFDGHGGKFETVCAFRLMWCAVPPYRDCRGQVGRVRLGRRCVAYLRRPDEDAPRACRTASQASG